MTIQAEAPGYRRAGSIRSGPPPLVTASVGRAAGSVAIVTDDGVGGADPARGTGLAGLARRAESVDGILEIASPPGGPTLLTVDLPCVR